MAVLVVGGGGRGVGKTAVACALMAALPELRWAAVKVSPHSHGLEDGVWEEMDRESDKDTGRYLRVGAQRAFLARGAEDAQEMVKKVRALTADCDAVLVESNRVKADTVANAEEPVFSLAVVSGAVESKASLLDILGTVDALMVAAGTAPAFVAGVASKCVFRPEAGNWVTLELVDLIRNRLLPCTTAHSV